MNYLFKSQRLGFRLISKDDINSIFEINSSPIEMKYFLKSLKIEEFICPLTSFFHLSSIFFDCPMYFF